MLLSRFTATSSRRSGAGRKYVAYPLPDGEVPSTPRDAPAPALPWAVLLALPDSPFQSLRQSYEWTLVRTLLTPGHCHSLQGQEVVAGPEWPSTAQAASGKP